MLIRIFVLVINVLLMDVVCTLDDNYLIPTGVLLTSLCENNSGEDITVYIVAYQLKKETISSLENIVKGNYNQKIEFYYSSFEEVLGKFNLGNPEGHLSLAAFFLSSSLGHPNLILNNFSKFFCSSLSI